MSPTPAILTDTTLCTSCEECVAACKAANGLGADVPRRGKARIDDLSPTRYTTMVRREGGRFVRRLCRHCLEPACVSACLVGALQKTPEGPVIYDPSRCMGCRYCLTSCPFGIPRYDWEQPVPFVRKCTMCYERQKRGEPPACTAACPYGATIFGDRDELLHLARQRIQAEPGKYVDAVLGESELGGTSVLYISDVPLDFLAFAPDLDDRPLPALTWAALSKVPPLVVGVTGLMAGLWWITGRRNALAAEASRRRPEPTPAAAPGPEEGGRCK
ncbi:MAG: 4Fe-4S dicluster domain-containing protein [Planctomycetota bacterium]